MNGLTVNELNVWQKMNIASNQVENAPFEVFFDGQCPLCKREIDMVRRHDTANRLKLTDIAEPGFQPPDVSLTQLMREIHGRYADGTFVTGVEVFREIYSRIGYSAIVRTTRWPIIRHAMDLAYKCFAYLRFKHAMHRINKSTCNETCSSLSNKSTS